MTRRSYEARVVLAPLGASGSGVARGSAELGLEGVATYQGAGGNGHGLEATAAGADVVVLLAADLTEVDAAYVDRIGTVARLAGCLVAAVVVDDGHGPLTGPGMTSLREAVDMLVVVRSVRLAASFLDVVRGGSAPRPSAQGA
ncbi:hypothetical protein [Pseudonocardia acidicola]|uniref:Uncharacterized protein n=1 Tax=Pseudonocardia acidicola TaxID=2724939 RepID=A0ABX1SA61_9PSEU|nr:hypothetical protein [Pseudonocardia acidicola]NMH97452.1 hypothetical protein [Pseudonocardia acidicola]